jgi:tRNA pseudouridine55 synthase
MDGLLIVDKPAGPTSHDVVARVRRALGEARIGHTGTLDPAATGVLALVLGRATRLAQFLSHGDKSYDAVVRFGFATDTGDAQGRPIDGAAEGPMPTVDEINAALNEFRGRFLQQPPAFSAKKIAGKRSHALARARARAERTQTPGVTSDEIEASAPATLPAPVEVTAHAIDVVSSRDGTVTLRIDCSAGFYVRALAHDLGARLGVGAHLISLRRTRAGDFSLAEAIPLETVERDPERARGAVIDLAGTLPALPAVVLTSASVRRAANGCALGPADVDRGLDHLRAPSLVRLLDPAGALIGIARAGAASGLLFPSVILITC